MSTPHAPGPDEADLAAITAREERASEMVARLCAPRDDPEHRDWLMSIPARPDRDPDLVIAAALADIPALVAEVRRLRQQERERRENFPARLAAAAWRAGRR